MALDPERQDLFDYLNTQDAARFRRRRPHRLPPPAYTAADATYFFTLCAVRPAAPFLNPELARAVISALTWRRERHQWSLYAYCLMPDHLHFIARLPVPDAGRIGNDREADLSPSVLDQVRDFKRYTTTQIWWKHGGRGALWQPSSYDRIVRPADSIEAAIEYVLENPVRKGLVERGEEYPFATTLDAWRPE
jgi:putative transposase